MKSHIKLLYAIFLSLVFAGCGDCDHSSPTTSPNTNQTSRMNMSLPKPVN